MLPSMLVVEVATLSKNSASRGISLHRLGVAIGADGGDGLVQHLSARVPVLGNGAGAAIGARRGHLGVIEKALALEVEFGARDEPVGTGGNDRLLLEAPVFGSRDRSSAAPPKMFATSAVDPERTCGPKRTDVCSLDLKVH